MRNLYVSVKGVILALLNLVKEIINVTLMPIRFIINQLIFSQNRHFKRMSFKLISIEERLSNDITSLWRKIKELETTANVDRDEAHKHAATAYDKADIIGRIEGHTKIVEKIKALGKELEKRVNTDKVFNLDTGRIEEEGG